MSANAMNTNMGMSTIMSIITIITKRKKVTAD